MRELSSCSPVARNQFAFVETCCKSNRAAASVEAGRGEQMAPLEKVWSSKSGPRSAGSTSCFTRSLPVPKQDLRGRVTDCSRDGFCPCDGDSVYSFIRMARLAEPMMRNGGCLLTVSHYGAEKVVDHYNIMGPVKAALEGTVRYLAAELGPQGIRVNALSPRAAQDTSCIGNRVSRRAHRRGSSAGARAATRDDRRCRRHGRGARQRSSRATSPALRHTWMPDIMSWHEMRQWRL